MAAPPITRTPIHDDDGSGTTGTIIDNAWKQELYGQIDAVNAAALAAGAWQNIPFLAANFTAPGATWTVTAAGQTITQIGPTLYLVTLDIDLANNTLSGTPPGILNWKVPVTSARRVVAPFTYYGPATGTGSANIQPGGVQVNLLRDPSGLAFPVGSYYIGLQLHIPV